MLEILGLVGRVIGAGGVLVCLFAGIARVTGQYYVLGVEAESLFILGIALMVAACLAKLEVIAATSHG